MPRAAMFTLLTLATLPGCGQNHAPVLQPIGDQTATVGTELAIQISASDPDGDTVHFSFDAPDLPDLKTRVPPATLSLFANNLAIFRWTPLATDVRDAAYALDLKASDGKLTSVETVHVQVTGGGGGGPIFREPLGSGTELDLTKASCVDVDIVVEDTRAAMVTIAEEAPLIDGAKLTSTGAFTATWHWCPTPDQIAAQDTYQLVLSADDGQQPAAAPKVYLIVLRKGTKANCPGAAPVIDHTPPAAQSTLADITITANVTDDIGLKSAPLLYYTTTAPSPSPNPSQMKLATMTRTSGTAANGVYTGTLPNPVASAPAGTMATLYYLFVATDADDPTGQCDHTTQEPPDDVFSVDVTNPGGTGGQAPCTHCTSDAQCGGANDNCITIGGDTFCSQWCGDTGAPACPSGYTCSTGKVTSANGAQRRQCQPANNTCTMAAMCSDDTFEPNNSRTTITNAMAANLMPGTYNLAWCPGSGAAPDEDWFAVTVSGDATITANLSELTGTDVSALDLQLVDKNGAVLQTSHSAAGTPSVSKCIPGASGKAFLRVFTPETAPFSPNLYDMTVTRTADNCACPADMLEPNNGAANATVLPDLTTTYTGLRICAGDQDWFSVDLLDGDTLTVDLTFTQNDASQDLDIHLFRSDGAGGATDLTPCPPVDSCLVNNGQGSSSNEHFVWTIAPGDGDLYFIVVMGYNGATNSYDFKAVIN